MKNKLNTKDKATATLHASTSVSNGFKFKNPVVMRHYRDGKLLATSRTFNLFTNEGLDDCLEILFSDGAQDTTHYVGLTTASVIAGDSLASGLDEFTDYTGDRQAWVEGGVSSQSIDNVGNLASFAITGADTVVGAFLTNAESGTGGILICGVDFAGSRTVAADDTLTVEYTITAADA